MKKLSLVLMLVFAALGTILAQRTVTGTIIDQDGETLIGANVLVKGTTTGTVTDIDGKYTIQVPEGSNTLVVSYTGFTTEEIELGVSNVMDVTLSEGITLSEAVVTALGISRDEKSLGYAVQEVDGEDLSNAQETNIVNTLQGKVAGIQIQGSPSSIGGSSRITIRGSNSFLGSNQPLFVIDGVPVDNSNFATNSTQRGFGANEDGTRDRDPYDYGNTAQDIDPESIQSMSVLKGAAASALYGTRGANGVILITTKDGSGRQGFGVEVNSSVSFDKVANLIPHQREYGGGSINPNTSHGFTEVTHDGQTYLTPAYSKDGSWGPKYDGTQVRHWDSWDPNNPATYKQTRPWSAPANDYESFFETGVTFRNGFALSGANDQGSFRLGYTNTDQSGTFPNARLDRNAFSLNSNYQIHDRVKVGFVGNYVKTDAENRNVIGYNNGNPMQAFTQWWQTQLDLDRLKDGSTRIDGTQQTWNPQGPQLDANGNLLFFDQSPNFFDNPYWVRDNYLQEDTRNRYYGNANVTINLAEGLDLYGQLGSDNYQFSTREGIPPSSVESSRYVESERRFQETNMEVRLNYNKNFGRISLNASAGSNRMRQLSRRTELNSTGGLSLDGFFHIDNSAGPKQVVTETAERGINSVFGLASIGWDNWLYLDVTGRNDWSSTLPDANNSYFYPSVSLSAVLTDLPSMSNLGPVSFLKVRASYAEVGLDADPYSLEDVFAPQTPNFGTNPRYSVPNARNNPDLKPERTSEYEFGLDLRFFNNRIGLDFAFFDRTTVDQIYRVPVSAATGYTSRRLNAGEMNNKGFEIALNTTPVQTKDFRWDLGVNLYRQKNKVVKLAEGIESIDRGNTWAADLRVAEDLPYMSVFGQDFIRENYVVDDETGEILENSGRPVVDEDGWYMMTPNRVFLGSAIADWTGGVSTSISYKGVYASALVDFQEGGVIHSTSLQWAKYSGMHPETVSFNGVSDVRADGLILPGVKADGSENDIAIDPQTYYQGSFGFAAPNVYEGSFIKLREVRVGYTIPNSLLGSSPFRDITVSLFGRNLAILASDLPFLDPQVISGAGNDQGLENAQVPSTRSFGVNLKFKL